MPGQKAMHYPNPGVLAEAAASTDNVAEQFPPATPPPAYNTEPTTVNYVVNVNFTDYPIYFTRISITAFFFCRCPLESRLSRLI